MVEPSASQNGQMVYIYSAYVMHAYSDFLSHGGYIYYINYMVLLMSLCPFVCGVVMVMSIRISDRC